MKRQVKRSLNSVPTGKKIVEPDENLDYGNSRHEITDENCEGVWLGAIIH